MPTPFADRSDVVLGIRNIDGRPAGTADPPPLSALAATGGTGDAGELPAVRYTMPVPVRGFNFGVVAPPAPADELRATGPDLLGDRAGPLKGNGTPSCGGALMIPVWTGRIAEGGRRLPRDGFWRSDPDDPRDARWTEGVLAEAECGTRVEPDGSVARRRFPADCGKRKGRGTPGLGVEAEENEESAGDGAEVVDGVADVSRYTSGVMSGAPARSSRAGTFLPIDPARPRTGRSSGVMGMGRLALEDVEGVLNPTSSPSWM